MVVTSPASVLMVGLCQAFFAFAFSLCVSRVVNPFGSWPGLSMSFSKAIRRAAEAG